MLPTFRFISWLYRGLINPRTLEPRRGVFGALYYGIGGFAAFIVIGYMGKVYICDAALGLGSTDAVRGSVGEWGNYVMLYFFGKRSVDAVVSVLRK